MARTAVAEHAYVDFEVSTNAKLTSYGVSDVEGSPVAIAVQTDWLRPVPRRRVEDIFLDGILALQIVRQKHPAWFGGEIEYPDEDFSSPDFSGVEVELPD